MKKSKEIPNNIFFFILDAVRKDHLSTYGYKRKTSPNIDKLSQQATIYNWAFSPSSYTISSVPSMLSSKYPFQLKNLFTGINYGKDDFTIFKNLKKLGYKTAMFTANIVTSSKWTNLNQYFDYMWDDFTDYEINRPEFLIAKSSNLLKAVEKYILKNKKKKNFIVIHLMEAHGPYMPSVDSIFNEDDLFKKDKRVVEKVVFDDLRGVTEKSLSMALIPKCQILKPILDENGGIEDFERKANYYIAKYDMGIYTQDKNMGIFFEFLKKKKIFDSSSIAITSDHGELMGENNIFFSHGIFTHPALINVPLIVKEPFQKNKILNNENKSTVDIVPIIIGNGIKSYKSTSLNKEWVYSFTAKSLSIIDENKLYMIHNGEFHHAETMYECLLPTNNFDLKKIFDNYINFKSDFHLSVFKKNKNSFTELKNIDLSDFKKIMIIYGDLLKTIFSVIKDNYQIGEMNQEKIFDLELKLNLDVKKRQLENEEYAETRKNLEKQIYNLNTTLLQIKNSKFFKLWQSFNKLKRAIIKQKE